MLDLALYTLLPELWEAFSIIITVSPMTETGFTLTGADIYIQNCELPQVTHREFWRVMIYFLNRTNSKFMERKKAKMKQLKFRKE